MPDSTDDAGADSTADGLMTDAVDAFATLGHPLRLAIVTTLQERSANAPLAFSELYDTVDADGSAKFNYHLGELRGGFVAKTDDGYVLTAAGERLARAVLAGRFTDAPELDAFDLEGACRACGERALVGAYADEHVHVECGACGHAVLSVGVPPSLVRGRDPEAFAAAFDQWSRSQVERATRGLCPDCGGAVEPSVQTETGASTRFDVLARFRCTVCSRRVVTSVGAVAATDPVVERFHHDRGDPLADRPYWTLAQYTSDDAVDVERTDPFRARVAFACDGDACYATVNADLAVVDTAVVRDEVPAFAREDGEP
jgi:ribosomal protein S27E